ncbi:protein phosphatase CheZ [Marinomonas mediterranea]|jgi:Chemotaxis protein|uniref:Protein phosphatase CheZ n=1 Tax=Marinomonas mediterranea (strain ATCC 700492 / JCM 21426 / NBRC 103028 / MMB-1) TaxID=717774 RepID=F2K3J2_MARM1|nr:protein phosphatase CheZ [Marinomonas mediterranea]ADZ92431.1 chemotaxis phosphatase, CheZ [Marinomonas mediterranea MMB-1]WCN10383.1 protein phosphatase [Marinomonas mediterranea]WCN14429.1 protein phosphatase [Marinomonas mediterranea]WCN18481.1 protein phosphatase [Marinomonas mediterranea MMB-1]
MSDFKESKLGDFETTVKDGAIDLLNKLEAGDFSGAIKIIQELSEARHKSFYHEVGTLTRSLHDAIRDFQIESMEDVLETADGDNNSRITDASDRLTYVTEMTSSAANKTMDMVDSSVPVASELKSQAESLHKDWNRLIQRDLTPQEFRELYKRIDAFLGYTKDSANTLHGNLNTILLEQGYQDLTGQVIARVSELIRDVEEKLVHLVAVAGRVDSISGLEHEIAEKEHDDNRGHGPAVNTENNPEVLNSQDEVDDLLSSLGF